MSNSDVNAAFGTMFNAFLGRTEDKGASFPPSDASDLGRGARDIPAEVTMARRDGQTVRFDQSCTRSACWFWEFPDGSRVYHRPSCHRQPEQCGGCGNTHLQGGKFAADGTPLTERYR